MHDMMPITNYRKNHGRIYKCGTVPPAITSTSSADEEATITSTPLLLDYLCTVSSRDFGKSAWRRRILRGEISVDGSVVTEIDHPLTPGCRVAYHRPPWNEPVAVLEDDRLSSSSSAEQQQEDNPHSLKILYQDEHLMAVHKPSGLPTMHSQTYVEYTVLNVLRTAALSNTTTTTTTTTPSAPPQPVHRLGVGTSGVMLIATSLQGRKALSLAIREKRVKKVYRALVRGADIPDSLRIDCPIGKVPFPVGGGVIYAACPPSAAVSSSATTTIRERDDDDNGHDETNMESRNGSCCSEGIQAPPPPSPPTGKKSLSFVRVVRRNAETDEAVVDVEIPTGRPHQIRIHMAYAGHPLVGDPLYLSGGVPDSEPRLFPRRKKEEEDMDTDDDEEGAGGEFVMRVPLPRDCGYSLHAHQYTVEHPTTGQWMTFTAKPPANLR